MVALVLQIAGFALAALFLVLYWFGVVHSPDLFVLAFGVHAAGDILFVAEEGLPNMSFSNIISSFESAVKIAPWLQFVGYMLVFMGLLAIGFKHQDAGKIIAYLGNALGMAGWVYKKIYP